MQIHLTCIFIASAATFQGCGSSQPTTTAGAPTTLVTLGTRNAAPRMPTESLSNIDEAFSIRGPPKMGYPDSHSMFGTPPVEYEPYLPRGAPSVEYAPYLPRGDHLLRNGM